MHHVVYIVAAGFGAGVLIRSLAPLGWPLVALFVLCAAASVVFVFRSSVDRRVMLGIALLLVCAAAGIARTHMLAPPETVAQVPVGEGTAFEGVVVREPDERAGYTNLTLESETLPARVLLRASAHEEFAYGDVLAVSGVLERPENFRSDDGRVFNYRGYLAKDDIRFVIDNPTIERTAIGEHPLGTLFALKQNYLDTLSRYIPEPAAALAGGITVGARRALGEELSEQFRDTGLIHIVVLSGYNITIIIIALSVLLSFIPERARFAVSILAIALFTILVGASATVVRAALMGSIGALGAVTHRTHSALHALVIAGLAMLVWNPYLLLYDPSFQLSFVATLGLLLGVPLLLPYLSFIPDHGKLRELVAATVTTQIAVTPLLLYMMGEVSLVALPVNMLALLIIPFAMLGTFLTGVVGMTLGALAWPFAIVTYGMLNYVLAVVDLFASMPFTTTQVPPFPFWGVLLMYFVLVVLWWLWRKRTAPAPMQLL